MNIILCGLPMSGKSTIGKILAEKLKWNFIDTDRLIESAYDEESGRTYTCRQIYAEEGEDFFRHIESQQITSLQGSERRIIAVGGGSLNVRKNVDVLHKLGKLVYLKVSNKVLWERIQAKALPAYLDVKDPEKNFYELAGKRSPVFERAADYIIETDNLNEQQTMEKILQLKIGMATTL